MRGDQLVANKVAQSAIVMNVDVVLMVISFNKWNNIIA
jgi:hypothetical protein